MVELEESHVHAAYNDKAPSRSAVMNIGSGSLIHADTTRYFCVERRRHRYLPSVSLTIGPAR
jgi:hypothetical protein